MARFSDCRRFKKKKLEELKERRKGKRRGNEQIKGKTNRRLKMLKMIRLLMGIRIRRKRVKRTKRERRRRVRIKYKMKKLKMLHHHKKSLMRLHQINQS